MSAKTEEKVKDIFKYPAENILNKIESDINNIDKNTVSIKHCATHKCVTLNIPPHKIEQPRSQKEKSCC
jgi:hypothetical protein